MTIREMKMAKNSSVEFSIGDVVQLNSGGPDMSIYYISENTRDISCQWFAGKKLEEGTFESKGLTLIRKQDAENAS